MDTVSLNKFVDHLGLKVITCKDKLDEISITQSDINRPALQLAGFFDYFDHHRVQIIGGCGEERPDDGADHVLQGSLYRILQGDTC